jgi:hypothetical protein
MQVLAVDEQKTGFGSGFLRAIEGARRLIEAAGCVKAARWWAEVTGRTGIAARATFAAWTVASSEVTALTFTALATVLSDGGRDAGARE